MSERIHCDGPGCEKSFRTDAPPLDWMKLDIIDHLYTVYGHAGVPPWHFCSAKCGAAFLYSRMPRSMP